MKVETIEEIAKRIGQQKGKNNLNKKISKQGGLLIKLLLSASKNKK
ncbi:MAG: hypothetical protein ACOX5F_10580 [Anaerovoracaceae bacterium]|jgi:hypothetical protein